MDGGADDEDVGILEVKSQLLHFHSGLYKQSLLLVLVFFLLNFKLKFKLVNSFTCCSCGCSGANWFNLTLFVFASPKVWEKEGSVTSLCL